MPPIQPMPSLQTPPPSTSTALPVEEARAAGQAFEAAFLAEMLQHAGLGQPRSAFGGGPGEAQFAPFLARAYAEEIAAARPIGIAEAVVTRLSGASKGGTEDTSPGGAQ